MLRSLTDSAALWGGEGGRLRCGGGLARRGRGVGDLTGEREGVAVGAAPVPVTDTAMRQSSTQPATAAAMQSFVKLISKRGLQSHVGPCCTARSMALTARSSRGRDPLLLVKLSNKFKT